MRYLAGAVFVASACAGTNSAIQSERDGWLTPCQVTWAYSQAYMIVWRANVQQQDNELVSQASRTSPCGTVTRLGVADVLLLSFGITAWVCLSVTPQEWH